MGQLLQGKGRAVKSGSSKLLLQWSESIGGRSRKKFAAALFCGYSKCNKKNHTTYMPSKLERKVDSADRMQIHWQGVSILIKRNLAMPGISLKEPDAAKLEPLMTKLKKPAE